MAALDVANVVTSFGVLQVLAAESALFEATVNAVFVRAQ
jgi:hypothetical protein